MNRFPTADERWPRAGEVIKMNKVVDVDITNKCTLKCSACARQNFDDPKMIPGGDASIKDFQKILDYFDDVYLCGSYGDPIFNPNTIKFLKMAYDQNKFIQVHTAASHKPMSWYEEAFKANPSAVWYFGLDGLPYQSFAYRENQDGEYLFDVMLKAKDMNIEVIWQYLVFGYNEDSIDYAKELARRHKIKIEIHHTSRYDPSIDRLKPKKEIVKDTDQTDAIFEPKCLKNPAEKVPYISAKGQLYPCCWLDGRPDEDPEYAVLQTEETNIKYNTVDEIMNSDIIKTFYDNLSTSNCPKYCKKKCTTNLRNPSRIIT